MGTFRSKIRSWGLPKIIINCFIIINNKYYNYIIKVYYNYYISNNVLLEARDKEENVEITGTATISV
jgi:hypothetical protein